MSCARLDESIGVQHTVQTTLFIEISNFFWSRKQWSRSRWPSGRLIQAILCADSSVPAKCGHHGRVVALSEWSPSQYLPVHRSASREVDLLYAHVHTRTGLHVKYIITYGWQGIMADSCPSEYPKGVHRSPRASVHARGIRTRA